MVDLDKWRVRHEIEIINKRLDELEKQMKELLEVKDK